MLLHALPYQLLALGIRLARPDADTEATYKIAGGVVIYPLAWAFEAWLVHRFGGTAWLVGFLLVLLPAGFFALAWQARWQNVAREARGCCTFSPGAGCTNGSWSGAARWPRSWSGWPLASRRACWPESPRDVRTVAPGAGASHRILVGVAVAGAWPPSSRRILKIRRTTTSPTVGPSCTSRTP